MSITTDRPGATDEGPDTTAHCPGCAEFAAVHARLCPELPADVRAVKRETDRAAQRRYEAAVGPLVLPRAV